MESGLERRAGIPQTPFRKGCRWRLQTSALSRGRSEDRTRILRETVFQVGEHFQQSPALRWGRIRLPKDVRCEIQKSNLDCPAIVRTGYQGFHVCSKLSRASWPVSLGDLIGHVNELWF